MINKNYKNLLIGGAGGFICGLMLATPFYINTRSDLKEANERVDQLTSEKQNLKKKITEKKSKISSLKDKAGFLEDKVVRLEDEIDKLESKTESSKSRSKETANPDQETDSKGNTKHVSKDYENILEEAKAIWNNTPEEKKLEFMERLMLDIETGEMKDFVNKKAEEFEQFSQKSQKKRKAAILAAYQESNFRAEDIMEGKKLGKKIWYDGFDVNRRNNFREFPKRYIIRALRREYHMMVRRYPSFGAEGDNKANRIGLTAYILERCNY